MNSKKKPRVDAGKVSCPDMVVSSLDWPEFLRMFGLPSYMEIFPWGAGWGRVGWGVGWGGGGVGGGGGGLGGWVN
jgi:hypothetical protein